MEKLRKKLPFLKDAERSSTNSKPSTSTTSSSSGSAVEAPTEPASTTVVQATGNEKAVGSYRGAPGGGGSGDSAKDGAPFVCSVYFTTLPAYSLTLSSHSLLFYIPYILCFYFLLSIFLHFRYFSCLYTLYSIFYH